MTPSFLDFTPVREKRLTLAELTADLTPADLRDLTNSMIDAMLAAIADCRDELVTYIPHDPHAHVRMPPVLITYTNLGRWGNVIVQADTLAEEAAFVAVSIAPQWNEFSGQ